MTDKELRARLKHLVDLARAGGDLTDTQISRALAGAMIEIATGKHHA